MIPAARAAAPSSDPDYRAHFSRFLQADPERLHFAAHSHHPWPDVSREAQIAAWDDAARLIDDKWDEVLGPVLDSFRRHVAGHLRLPNPETIAVAPNTHELMMRILSCLPAGRPVRILTSDGEFLSFARQISRLEEDGLVAVTRVPVAPRADFAERLGTSGRQGFDLVVVSQVFFNSGFVVDIDDIVAAAGDAMLVVDGYHGFMALGTDLARHADRLFYMAGGYKYAMSGEGCCLMHCPPGYGLRPRDTGWFAGFAALTGSPGERVLYSEGGTRFFGATFDPSGLYRFNAVMSWLASHDLDANAIHAHAHRLQRTFVEELKASLISKDQLVIPVDDLARGNFLAFDTGDAAEIYRKLKDKRIVTDVRGTRLRIGFGLYQTEEEVARLLSALCSL